MDEDHNADAAGDLIYELAGFNDSTRDIATTPPEQLLISVLRTTLSKYNVPEV